MSHPPLRRSVVAVLLPDRVGILRDVTAGVVALDGNIGGIRQTLVDGFFNLVCTFEHPARVTDEEIRRELASRLEPSASVVVLAVPDRLTAPVPAGSRYVAMTRGPDRPGTIHAISAFFVEFGINIEDWQVETEGADVIYTAQVSMPEALDFREVQAAFRSRLAPRGLTAAIYHENIFRATNEIGPIKRLGACRT
jgi:predicted amino acid-binding ACT domain protein